MKQRDIETIQDAASFCEIVCNEIECTSETSELIDACRRVSRIVRRMDSTCEEEQAAELAQQMMDVIKNEGSSNA